MNRSLLTLCGILLMLVVMQPMTVHAKSNQNNEQGSTNGQPFKTLRSMIDLLAQDLDAAIVVLNDRISSAETQLQLQIDSMGETLAAHEQTLAAHDQLINEISSAIHLLETRVSINENDIAALEAVDMLHNQRISALEARLMNLEGRVAANESDILALFAADATLQQLIMANKNKISTLEMRINANDGDITNLQQDILNIEQDIIALNNELSNKQNRITGVCPSGSSIRKINSQGGVTCEVDTVSAGVGSPIVTRVANNDELASAGFTVGLNVIRVNCPSNTRVTGGGFSLSPISDFGDVRLIQVAAATTENNGYILITLNDNAVAFGNGRVSATAFAQCMRIQ